MELLRITVCSFFEMGCVRKYCFPPHVTGNLKPCSHSERFHTGRIGCKILCKELKPEDMNSAPVPTFQKIDYSFYLSHQHWWEADKG